MAASIKPVKSYSINYFAFRQLTVMQNHVHVIVHLDALLHLSQLS